MRIVIKDDGDESSSQAGEIGLLRLGSLQQPGGGDFIQIEQVAEDHGFVNKPLVERRRLLVVMYMEVRNNGLIVEVCQLQYVVYPEW